MHNLRWFFIVSVLLSFGLVLLSAKWFRENYESQSQDVCLVRVLLLLFLFLVFCFCLAKGLLAVPGGDGDPFQLSGSRFSEEIYSNISGSLHRLNVESDCCCILCWLRCERAISWARVTSQMVKKPHSNRSITSISHLFRRWNEKLDLSLDWKNEISIFT